MGSASNITGFRHWVWVFSFCFSLATDRPLKTRLVDFGHGLILLCTLNGKLSTLVTVKSTISWRNAKIEKTVLSSVILWSLFWLILRSHCNHCTKYYRSIHPLHWWCVTAALLNHLSIPNNVTYCTVVLFVLVVLFFILLMKETDDWWLRWSRIGCRLVYGCIIDIRTWHTHRNPHTQTHSVKEGFSYTFKVKGYPRLLCIFISQRHAAMRSLVCKITRILVRLWLSALLPIYLLDSNRIHPISPQMAHKAQLDRYSFSALSDHSDPSTVDPGPGRLALISPTSCPPDNTHQTPDTKWTGQHIQTLVSALCIPSLHPERISKNGHRRPSHCHVRCRMCRRYISLTSGHPSALARLYFVPRTDRWNSNSASLNPLAHGWHRRAFFF